MKFSTTPASTIEVQMFQHHLCERLSLFHWSFTFVGEKKTGVDWGPILESLFCCLTLLHFYIVRITASCRQAGIWDLGPCCSACTGWDLGPGNLGCNACMGTNVSCDDRVIDSFSNYQRERCILPNNKSLKAKLQKKTNILLVLH